MTQPALFISHGAPDLALVDGPAHRALRRIGAELQRPDAILIVSAHHEASRPSLRAPSRFQTWHDFGRSFSPRLFEMRYEPLGAPALAAQARQLLEEAGLQPVEDHSPLLDHGAWVPLSLLFPAADVPVAALSIEPRRDAAWHYALGAAIAPLRARNVLVIGSGSVSHNLHEVFRGAAGDRRWVESFTSWLEAKVRAGDRDALLAAMDHAPDAARNHPTDEHLLPFYVAMGAGGPDAFGARLHHSFTYGVLAMDIYAFAEAEQALIPLAAAA